MGLFDFLSSKTKPLKEDIDLSILSTDIHSHLIPCVDDGSQSMQESISLLRQLSDLGYKKVITTPHLFENSFPEGIEILDEKVLDLRNEAKNNGINIEIEVGCELLLDDDIKGRIKNKQIKSFGDNNILFEIPMSTQVNGLENWLFDLQLEKYNLIIAHPERYLYYSEKKFTELKDRGILFQLNMISLSGYYGKEVQTRAEWMVESNLIDLVGSDCHGQRHIDALKRTLRNPYLKKLIDSGRLQNNKL